MTNSAGESSEYADAVTGLVSDVISMAAQCSDAPACAERTARHAERTRFDKVSLLTAARMRTAGMLDREPDNLCLLVAHGLTSLASLYVLESDRERARLMSGAQ